MCFMKDFSILHNEKHHELTIQIIMNAFDDNSSQIFCYNFNTGMHHVDKWDEDKAIVPT